MSEGAKGLRSAAYTDPAMMAARSRSAAADQPSGLRFEFLKLDAQPRHSFARHLVTLPFPRPGGASSRRLQRQLENSGRQVLLPRFIPVRPNCGGACRGAKICSCSVGYDSAKAAGPRPVFIPEGTKFNC